MVLVTIEVPQLLVDKVLDVLVWQVLRDPQVQAVMMTVVISQLHLVDVQMVWSRPLNVWAPSGVVHRLCDELKGGFFKAVCTGTRPGGHVHRDMAPHSKVQAAGMYGQTHISSTTSEPPPTTTTVSIPDTKRRRGDQDVGRYDPAQVRTG